MLLCSANDHDNYDRSLLEPRNDLDILGLFTDVGAIVQMTMSIMTGHLPNLVLIGEINLFHVMLL